MPSFNQVINFFINITAFDIIRLFILIILAAYIFFAFIIIRQVALMTKTLQIPINPFITLFGWFHLLLAIIVFLVTWTIF